MEKHARFRLLNRISPILIKSRTQEDGKAYLVRRVDTTLAG
jgi:hypothetical protein